MEFHSSLPDSEANFVIMPFPLTMPVAFFSTSALLSQPLLFEHIRIGGLSSLLQFQLTSMKIIGHVDNVISSFLTPASIKLIFIKGIDVVILHITLLTGFEQLFHYGNLAIKSSNPTISNINLERTKLCPKLYVLGYYQENILCIKFTSLPPAKKIKPAIQKK